MTRWQEICTNMPFVSQEILFAWEHGALSADNVKVSYFNIPPKSYISFSVLKCFMPYSTKNNQGGILLFYPGMM